MALVSTQLLQALGAKPAAAMAFAGPLSAALALHGIDTTALVAAFLAQAAHESALFSKTEEDMRWRDPVRLDATFSAVKGVEDARALIARGPQAIACRVYAHRNGNGDEASGDGWRFRGRGLFQLTGLGNYAAAAAAMHRPYVEQPELVTQPSDACLSAVWFWQDRGLSGPAKRGQIDVITLRINGEAMEGAAERRALYDLALGALA